MVRGVHSIRGEELEPLDLRDLWAKIRELAPEVDVFAISSYLGVRNAAYEASCEEDAEGTGLPCVCGHELTSELNSVERALTVFFNARLIPLIVRLIQSVVGGLCLGGGGGVGGGGRKGLEPRNYAGGGGGNHGGMFLPRKINQAVVVVLDGFGVGEAADAREFGDEGSNTLRILLRARPNLAIPNLVSLGLGQLIQPSPLEAATPRDAYGRMQEASRGKGYNDGPLGADGGSSPRSPSPCIPMVFPRKCWGLSKSASAGESSATKPHRERSSSKSWGGAPKDEKADCLYVGGQRLSDRGP